MSKRHRASPFATATLLLALTGCAASGGNSLQQAQAGVVRELTSQCFWNNEGKRLIFGAQQVHAACRSWATDRVRARFPDYTRGVRVAWE